MPGTTTQPALTVPTSGARGNARTDLGPVIMAAALTGSAARTVSRSSGSSWWGRTR